MNKLLPTRENFNIMTKVLSPFVQSTRSLMFDSRCPRRHRAQIVNSKARFYQRFNLVKTELFPGYPVDPEAVKKRNRTFKLLHHFSRKNVLISKN